MFAWVLVIILAVWLIVKYSSHSNKKLNGVNSIIPDHHTISEEDVFKAQNRFEKKFEETYLPDSLSGKEIYIYQNLMKIWFYDLIAKHRYNDEMTQKLRRDFLDYMFSTEQGSSSHYLSLELENEESKKTYEEEARDYARKIYTIENAFASSIGDEAIKELEKVRQLNYSAINKEGNLAPEGYKFDILGELKPIKSIKNNNKTV